MELIELDATAQRALELLTNAGMSDGSIYDYTHTGFGSILRHFHTKGILYATAEMLDNFLLEQRALLDQGDISQWKWGLVRRSCELLKQCSATDSIDLPDLQPWDPVWNRPKQIIQHDAPTAKQFAESENIYVLVWMVNKRMEQLGLSESTVRHYTEEGLAVILKKHYDSGTESYSDKLISQLTEERRLQYEQGEVGRTTYQNLRKAAAMLQEFRLTGKITLERIPNWGRREVIPQHKAILDKFSAHVTTQSNWAESSVSTVTSVARVFLLELEDHGIVSIETVAMMDIATCVTRMLGRYTGGMRSALFGIRTFLQFLYEAEITADNFCKTLPEFVCPRKNFREGFSDDELERLLSQPDITSAVGKRDYAMMVLAVQSGLRSCDIIRLTFDCINWRTMEIRVVQHKTGQPIVIPLEPETGNAIADYLLNGRPKSSLPQIFLCHVGAVRALKSRTGSASVSKYMKGAGIHSGYRGFHSFRRTFATNLLQNEVPIELIQQMLGQTHIDSAKPYLSIDEQGLKRCALPLLSHGKEVGN